MVGEVQVIFGPMFSGKSTELIRRIRRYTIAENKCIVLKHAIDVRQGRTSGKNIVTHDGICWSAKSCSEIVPEELETFDVIGIDEGQFFEHIVSACETLANSGKIVIVAALDGNFQRRPFTSTIDLVSIAETVVKLSAICIVCKKDASFTKRITDETEEIVVGGSEKYAAACRKCFRIQDVPSF